MQNQRAFAPPLPHIPTIQSIRDLVANDFAEVDRLIEERLYSEVELIQQISKHIIHSGGKRLRPLLVLIGARACSYQGHEHVELAAIVEFIHTATLLHDDVIDVSELRRGQRTAHVIWGNEASILVGDFLYSRAFQMMANLNRTRIMEVMADTTNSIAEGEVLQLMNRNNPAVDEVRYMNVIRHKTAKLFEAATQLGAIIAHCPLPQEAAMAEYGLHLGTAYQLIDDVLDYSANKEELGKNLGVDLAEGKPTLPLIYAMKHGTPEQIRHIQTAITQGGLTNLEQILQAIHSTQALGYARTVARQEADLALQALQTIPASPYRDALEALTDFVIERRS